MLFVRHPDRAAVLERMPAVEKNSPVSTNGDVIRESIKDPNQHKPLAGVSVLPLEPANQVFFLDRVLT